MDVTPLYRAITLAAFVGTVSLSTGCSNAAVSKAVGTPASGEPIVVEPSDAAVTVENHAGRPLLDVRVTLAVADTSTAYVRVAPTIDTNQSSEMALASFRSEDGTAFDPSVRPAQVTVTARDTLAKSYEVTVPWGP